MIKAIENNDYAEAASQMLDSRWANQVGKRAQRLSKLMVTG
jgi:lysozyme